MPKLPQKITDVIKLRNSKCKRSKNLIKKCMELSKLCSLKVNLVIFDETKNRIQEYSSTTDFRVEQICTMKQKPVKKTRKSLKIKYISNEDMAKYMKDCDDADYNSEDDRNDAEPAAAAPQQEFAFDDSSNKCDIDTAEDHDRISESDLLNLDNITLPEKPSSLMKKPKLLIKRSNTLNNKEM
jgi:hypothetical protein